MKNSRRWIAACGLLAGVSIAIACGTSSTSPDGGVDAASDVATNDVNQPTDAGADVADVAAEAMAVDACASDPCVTQLAAGYLYECARLADQTVRCWGSNAEGALGRALTGDASTSAVPAPVTGLSNIVQVAAGFYHACALRSDNHVLCWGGNSLGQLGPSAIDAGAIVLAPQDITGIPGTIDSIHAGGYFTCAHLVDKRVFCWGDAEWGNLGGTLGDAGTYVPRSQPTPLQVTAVGTPDEINAGDRYTCARTGANVACLGTNDFGQLGRPDASFSLNDDTAQIMLTGATRAFESEAYHACALASGNVLCWGDNQLGEVGTDAGAKIETPNAVPGLPAIADLSAGGISTCALTTTGTLKCWGSNVYGEMAQPLDAGTSFPSPIDISGVSNVVQVAAGHQTICALLQGGSVTCWGYNTSGELGRAPDAGVADYVPAPVAF